MQRARFSLAIISGVFMALLSANTASAQATRTWVSGVGDDVNPCSRTAPCKTYAGAISKTANSGEINCLDPAGYGSLTITKSISIVCDYTEGGITSPGTVGFIVNAPSGSTVSLVGHDIECAGTGTDGIRMVGAGVVLHINKVKIRGCRAANGINIANTSGVANVMISDSNITDSGAAVSNAGVLIRSTGGGSANVAIANTKLEANTNGIFFDGSGGAGASNLVVKDSVLTTSASNGIAVSSVGGVFKATVANSMISLNAGVGAAVAGASATLQLGGNTIAGNTTGVSTAGGTLLSFKNNQIGANGTDGTPITAFSGPGGQPLQ